MKINKQKIISILFIMGLTLFIIPVKAQQKDYSFKYNKTQINYLLYLPSGYEKTNKEGFPLILFLHGGGESGNNIELVKKNGIPNLIEAGEDIPFIVLSPQNPHEKKLWDDFALKALLDKIIKKYNVDEKRIYLTGLSRGGYGAWRMAVQYPEVFAAVAPVCGATPVPYAGWISDIPFWVFHGAKDTVIPISESENMVIALKSLGASVIFTIYPDAGHDSWTETYKNPKLYEWFLSHSK